ncbi:MAG: Plug domain-containing protein, partial [Odoribacter sp.]
MKLYRYTILLSTALSFFSAIGSGQEVSEKESRQTIAKERNWQDIFTYRPALFFDRGLMGEEVGVYTTNGGFVGGSGNLMIRGLSTINLNASPYVIISGMPVKQIRNVVPFVGGLIQNNWGFINPLDVRTIKIIKGGYDASFYGGKSGNGMVNIDFDRGTMGSAAIDFMARVGFSQADYSFDVMNAEQFRGYLYGMMESKGVLPTDLQKMNIFDVNHSKYNHRTDWLDELVGNGLFQDYNLKMKGGDGDTKYLFSLSYASEEETLKETDYQRFNMRFNLDYKISPKISISNSLSYNYTTLHFGEEGVEWGVHPIYVGLTKAPFMSPWHYTDEGVKVLRYEGVDELGKSNPVMFKDNLKNKGVENRVDAIIRGKWDFLKNTYLTTDIDVSYNGAVEKQHRGAEGIVMDENRERQNSKRNFSEFLLHWNLDLHHNGKVNEKMNYLTAAGIALESYNEKMVYGRTVNAATDEMESMSGGLDSVNNNRYDYKQLNFYINGKLLLGSWAFVAANLNLERSSNFGPDGKWNLYAGVDLNMNLWQTSQHILNLDLQWGRTGNNNIQEAYYSKLYLPTHY